MALIRLMTPNSAISFRHFRHPLSDIGRRSRLCRQEEKVLRSRISITVNTGINQCMNNRKNECKRKSIFFLVSCFSLSFVCSLLQCQQFTRHDVLIANTCVPSQVLTPLGLCAQEYKTLYFQYISGSMTVGALLSEKFVLNIS